MRPGSHDAGPRPVTVREMALAFGIPPRRLRSLIKVRGIGPSFVIEGLALYQGRDVRRVYEAVQDSGLIAEPMPSDCS